MRLLLVLLLTLPCLARAQSELTVVGFGGGFQDAARRALFEPWSRATGIPVRDDSYNGEMARIYAMTRTRDVVWDVVMVEAPELARGCEDGIFQRMDWSVVDRTKFAPSTTSECGAGAVSWGAALFWDTTRTARAPKGFAELWDTERFPGKRALRWGAKMTLEVALLADGVPRDQVYAVLATREGQDRAFRKLDAIRDDLVFWRSGAQPMQLVNGGEATYALGYTGRVVQANAQAPGRYAMDWGTLLWSVDSWAVVAGSPHAAEGFRFIQGITELEPLKRLAAIWPASPAHRAFAEDAAIRAANPDAVASHAAQGLFLDTRFWVEKGEDLEKRFAAWAQR